MANETENDLTGQHQEVNQQERGAPSRSDPGMDRSSGAAGKPDEGGLTDEDVDMFEDDPNIPTE